MRWALALVFLVGLLIRLPGLSAPPLNFHAMRQYRAAIVARGYVVDEIHGLTPQQVAAARAAAASMHVLEPPVIERLAAVAYRLAGRDDLRLARLVSVVAWMAGAAALAWLLGQLFATRFAAITGVAIMVLLPFAVVASQAVQPDSLMTALTVLAIALAVVHHHRRRAVLLASALVVAALAIFVKPMAVFFVLPALTGLAIERSGWVRGVLLGIAGAIGVVAPATVYFFVSGWPAPDYGLFTRLAGTAAYWSNWWTMLQRVVGLPLLALAVVSVAAAAGAAQRLLVALWLGYAVFGIAFAYRVSTHDYYSLPLVPVVGISAAALADAAARRGRSLLPPAVVVVAIAAGLAINLRTVHAAGLWPSTTELRARVARYERIGEAVGHSTRVVSLDGDYGYPLSYYGFLRASNLPLSIDLALTRLAGRLAISGAERLTSSGGEFFVATHQAELDAQPDLRALLDRQFPLIARDGTPDRWNYLVYDLRSTRISVTPERVSFFALVDGSRGSTSSVSLWSGAGARWRLDIPGDAPFDIVPREGAGPATLTFRPRSVDQETDRTVGVPIVAGDGSVPAAALAVRFRALRTMPSSPPFGFVDVPADPVEIRTSPVVFQGWALDYFDLRRVWAAYVGANGRTVEAGTARIVGARPDVAAVHPSAHDIHNNAWMLELQPSALAAAQGHVVLRFYAENGEGRRAEIGTRSIVRR